MICQFVIITLHTLYLNPFSFYSLIYLFLSLFSLPVSSQSVQIRKRSLRAGLGPVWGKLYSGKRYFETRSSSKQWETLPGSASCVTRTFSLQFPPRARSSITGKQGFYGVSEKDSSQDINLNMNIWAAIRLLSPPTEKGCRSRWLIMKERRHVFERACDVKKRIQTEHLFH